MSRPAWVAPRPQEWRGAHAAAFLGRTSLDFPHIEISYEPLKSSAAMGNSPNDGPLTKPSLGQDVQLGMLYDYRTSSLFAGVSLWDHDVVNPPEEASTTSVQNADYRFSSSLDEARSNAQLDVEGSLTLDLGIVHVTGSAKYLSIKKSSAHEARVDVSCTITRRTRRVSQETLAKIQYPSRLEDARFTHFVAEVVEGGTATLTFARTCNSADDEEQVQGQLAATLKGANFIEGKVKLDYQNDEHQLKDTVRITYSGAMAESVATLEDASRIAKNMPTQLMNQMNTLSYKLVPLSVLDSKAARELRKLDTVLVERTSAVLKAAEAVLLDDVFVSQAERGVKIAAIQSQISRFKQAYTRAHGAFQATVKDLLPKLYDGKTEDYAGKFAELERAVTLHELRTDVAKTFASRKSDEAMYLQRMTDDLKANGKFENFVDDRSFQPRLNGPKYLILSFAGKGLGVVESWLDKLNDPLKVTTIKDVCIQDEVNRDRIHSSYLALKALCEAQDVAVDMPDQVAFGVAHIPTLGNNETLVGDVVFVDGGTFKVVTGTLPSGNLDFTPNVSRITQTSATVDLPWEVRKEEEAFPTTAIHVCWRHRPAKNASKPTWDGAVTVLRSLGSPTVELQPLEPNADYDIQLCLYTALGPTSWSRVKRLQTAKMQRPLNATDIVTIKNRGSGGMLKNIGDAGVVVVDDEKLSQHCQWRRVPSQSGAVAFVNVGSGLYLDHYLNKTVLVSDGGTFNTCQQWTQEKTADGFCVIKNRSSGTVLSLRTRPSLHTSVSNHDISNQWKITKLDGGVVTITSRLCDLALGNPKGSRLEWCNDSGATNCQWRRIPTTDGYVTYENVVTKLFLESENEKTVGNQVPALTLPLAHFIHKLMNGLDGSAKIRAESCWYERVSPTLRAIITGQPVILESHERRERFYYPDKGFAYDSSRQNVFSWRPRWTPDGTKDQWRVIPSNRSDQFYLQSVYSNEFLYAADHHKQGDISRVFAWRSDTPVGDMGLWQLVDVDPTQRDVFVLYNPYQKQYLYSPNDSYDNNRRFVWTATHRENDTEWEQQRRWRITPATYPPMERGVEAFFRKQYPDAVALLTTALDEVQDHTERVKCHVYRMAANLRMGMTHQLQADYDRIRAIGVDTTAIFNGLHHLWVEIATFLNVPTAAVEDDTIRGFVRALENFAPSTSDAQQQWKELDAGGGFVTIENRSSTRYLACQTAQSVESINDKSTDLTSQWQIQSI